MITAADLLRDEDRARRAAEGIDAGEFLSLGRQLTASLDAGDTSLRPAAWGWLDLARRGGSMLRLAQGPGAAAAWPVILGLIDASEYTLARLIAQRVEAYGPRTLFLRPGARDGGRVTWLEAQAQIDHYARGLLALRRAKGDAPVAFLCENRLEMALLDLACLTTGIRNVMIPGNASDSDAGSVLERVRPGIVVVTEGEPMRRIERLRPSTPSIHTVLDLDDPAPAAAAALGLPQLLSAARDVTAEALADARETVRLGDIATVMFTSGTTGRPKGIQFTMRNLVAKRFARGLALPEIGDRDVFLCYLPLFHTFGRYFEMLGSIYWGATYAALPDPSLESLLDGFAEVRPTVFISIPLRWMQLHDEVARRVDLDRADAEEEQHAVRHVVGDRLRWGLSAAGYLSSETFRFFQRNGVELLSGFGMTEATGGITMTPPHDYRDESLGVPLPGIELRLEDDGELSVRGPYVTPGYFGEDEPGLDPDGWLRTGDLFERDRDGHYRLVDRKKEIYKNTKGQTIAPQKIENLFRDFAAVRRVFLVGDHRDYNTLLIVPETGFPALIGATADEQRDLFRSIVASVNRFLAPYERIVDFALLPRDFDPERGELTPKNTFRRPQVVENFDDLIARMYRRTRLRLSEDGPALIVNNWLFQALALTAGDIRFDGEALTVLPTGVALPVHTEGPAGENPAQDGWIVRVGACRYRVRASAIDLGLIVTCPALWLGNDDVVRFAPLDARTRVRRSRCPAEIESLGRAVPYVAHDGDSERLESAAQEGRLQLEDVDLAARALGSADETLAFVGLAVLRRALDAPDDVPPELARQALRGAARAPSMLTRREALRLLWPAERDEAAAATFERFLAGDLGHRRVAGAGGELFEDSALVAAMSAEDISDAKAAVWIEAVRDAVRTGHHAEHLPGLLTLLARHGADHPSRYQRLRGALAFAQVRAASPTIRATAHAARIEMATEFRRWLGMPPGLAVDPDTRREYRWDDAVVFAPEIGHSDRQRLAAAIRGTSMLREAIFMFSGGATLRLNDIVQGGVRVSPLGGFEGRSQYRITVETRYYGTFEIAVPVAHEMAGADVDEEILWLIVAGETAEGNERLVPEFGGYWPEHGLWTEEFIAGQTAAGLVERLARSDDPAAGPRLVGLWPFIAWSAAEAYLDFWDRTGRKLAIAHPAPDHVVVPTHDYQIGPRLIEIGPRTAYDGPAALLGSLRDGLLAPLVAMYAPLAQEPVTYLLCSALLEVVGVPEGLRLVAEAAEAADDGFAAELRAFAADVARHGFVARRLYFAIERYRRWTALAPDPTREAQAFTIRQLKETYQLERVYERFPEARARFFRETVLRRTGGPLGAGLDALVAGLQRREFTAEDLPDRIDALREHAAPGSVEEYFLVRLSWPHLRPGDAAGFISHERGGVRQSEVVLAVEDMRGRTFRVRRPLSPREVGDLHRLFLAAKLPVSFRPDHQFLVALDANGRLIGGLFYEFDPIGRQAHLEKVVVAEAYRQIGVSQAVMTEFLHRMQAAGVRLVTTGFFRPEYFARFGFRVDRAYGGQVKLLEDDARLA